MNARKPTKAYLQARMAQGLCPRCGQPNPHMTEHVTCLACLELMTKRRMAQRRNDVPDGMYCWCCQTDLIPVLKRWKDDRTGKLVILCGNCYVVRWKYGKCQH